MVAFAQATTVGTYKKVTEAPANGDWSGQYIITDANASKFFDASYKHCSLVGTTVKSLITVAADKSTITITQEVVDANLAYNQNSYSTWATTGNFHVTIDSENRLYSAYGKYMRASSSSNTIAYGDDAEATGVKNTISFDATNGSVIISSKNGTYNKRLQFGSVDIAYYQSTSKTPIYLYKLVTDEGGEGGEEGGDVVEPEDPETPVEPEQPEVTGAKLYFDVSLFTSYKNVPVVFSNETATDTVTMVAVEGQTNVFEVEVPAGNWSQITLVKKMMNCVLKNYDGVNNLFKFYPAAAFYNALAPTDGDGVWMKYGENFAVGSNIMPKQVVYFDPAVFGDACDSYDVVFVQTGNTKVTKVAATKLSDGKYYATVGNYVYTSFTIRGYKNKQFVASASNLTWDGAGALCTINADRTSAWSAYTEPERIMTATWNMEGLTDGKTEGFSSVQVTFSGIDPNGRLLGGDATGINLVANFAKAASFFKVDETGKETAVATLTNTNNGFLNSTKISDFTYELSLVPDAYELVDGKYMREGHYRIKILKQHVQIEPKPLNTLTASTDFVFDFTIDNDYVFPTIIDDMIYEVEPAKSVVSEVGEVVVAFDADITLSELQEKPVLKFGEITYPLNCEIVDGYQLKLTIAQEGVEKLTENGFYEITIPEGLVYYDDPAEKNINAEITFGFTIAPVMPANGVIYFDPSNEVTIDLVAKFVDGAGNTKGADVVKVGELYMIEMPKGDEWVRFDIEGWGVDPEDGISNLVLLYSVSNLFYNGENNLFTLNEDAPANATVENGVWGKHVVTPIEGGTTFYLNVASSPYFTENAANFIWKTKFVNAEDEAGAEMDSIDLGIYKVVAPEGTWDMFLLYFNFNGTDREYMGIYLEYDGENDMFVFIEDANPNALVGAWDKYVPNGEGGGPTNVENAMLSTIAVQDGMIMVEGEYQIYTITGQNVTSMNGSLEKGVYVVKSANAVVKVMVK